MPLTSIILSIFLLMDAIGNIPIFLSLLRHIEPKRQRVIIFRELVIAFFVIVSFYFIGDYLLAFLNISQQAVLISGGIILFLIGIKLVFPSKEPELPVGERGKEPFLVPLAIPLVAGPAVLAAVMLYSREIGIGKFLLALSIAWGLSTVLLLLATQLKKILGEQGLSACERLTGLLLIMISVQMTLTGLKQCLAPVIN